MGIFTYHLVRNIREYPQATYRQLSQAIAREYDTYSPNVPTPLFEGALDPPVFGEGGAFGTTAWTAHASGDVIQLEAGQLNGLDEGAEIELHPFANVDQSLGFARVTKAGLSASEAVPIERNGVAAASISDLPQDMSATMVARGLNFGLTIAMPPESDRSTSNQVAFETIEALRQLPVDDVGFASTWVDPKETADTYLRIKDGRIYFVPSSGEIVETGRSATPSLLLAPNSDNLEQLRDGLLRIARYQNLIRLVQVVDGVPEGNGSNDLLQIRAFLVRDESAGTLNEQRSCPKVPTKEIPRNAVPVELHETPELFHCDVVYLELRNRGGNPVDTTVLYVDGQYGIQSYEPAGRVRIDSGEVGPRIVPFQIETWGESGPATTGLERVLVIGVERDSSQSDTLSFAYFQQQGLEAAQKAAPKTRGSGGFAQLLQNAALAPAGTRAAAAPTSSEIENVTMRAFRWNVLPPPEASN